MTQIILASTSVYRKEQLQRLGVQFDTAAPDVDEQPLKQQGLDHIELSQQLALLKVQNVAANYPNAIVIGGDQVASFNGAILSKPLTKEKAFNQLKTLSGNTHQLITSLAICANGETSVDTCIATMHMRDLTDEQLVRYIDTDEPLYCCGSYRLEALGISLFETIDCSDYTSIIGIPLMFTAKTLSKLGVPVP